MTGEGASSSVRQLIADASHRLGSTDPAVARHEAEWLLAGLLHVRPVELYVDDVPISSQIADTFHAGIAARAGGQPLQYVVGAAEFFGRSFSVAPGVFIPRPETETIVQVMVDSLAIPRGQPLRLLELGTGTGCIAITLARQLPTCVVVAVELSWKALWVAWNNAVRHQVVDRICWVQGSWCDAIQGQFDGLIANPPYIPSTRVDGLPLDVRQEPRVSLDGGPDGLDALLHIMTEASRLVRLGGPIVVECGEDQVAPLCAWARHATWMETVRPIHDLAGRPRGVVMTAAPGAKISGPDGA